MTVCLNSKEDLWTEQLRTRKQLGTGPDVIDDCSVQAVLERHMGMRLTEMQRLSQLSPEEREGQTLTGAHLPTRGFYKIKSEAKIQKQASRQLTWCGISLWWRMPPPVPDSSVSDLHHVSADTELAEAASDDQSVVIEVKSEELLGAEPAAAQSQGALRDG